MQCVIGSIQFVSECISDRRLTFRSGPSDCSWDLEASLNLENPVAIIFSEIDKLSPVQISGGIDSAKIEIETEP